MRILMLALAGTSLTVAACNRTENADTAANEVMTTDNALATNDSMVAPAALPTTAPEFVNVVAASDKFEVESSRLAEASGSSAAVKSFAKQMIIGHTASTTKLKATIAGMTPALNPNDTLSAEQQALLDGLQGKTGAELDASYAAAQVTAHQKTLDVLNAYAGGGDNPKLTEFAKGMIPTVTAHLNLAKGLK